MSKSKKYRGFVLFLEAIGENNEDQSYFVTIYNRESQLDYTKPHAEPKLAYDEAKNIIDKWIK